MHDERVAQLRFAEEMLRRKYRSIAQETARVLRDVAVTRGVIAQRYDVRADHAVGQQADDLHVRACRLRELAERAFDLAEQEQAEALGR